MSSAYEPMELAGVCVPRVGGGEMLDERDEGVDDIPRLRSGTASAEGGEMDRIRECPMPTPGRRTRSGVLRPVAYSRWLYVIGDSVVDERLWVEADVFM